MNVLVMGTRGFPGVQGGIERHCEELYRRLALNNDIHITVLALSRYGDKHQANWNGIKFVYIKSFDSKNFEKLWYGLKATIYALRHRPDIVHVQGLNSAIYIPLLKLAGLKVVFTHHSRDYLYPKWSRAGKMILKLSERASLRADRIIAVSKLIYEHLKRFTDRLIIIPNGINIKYGQLSKSEARKYLDKHAIEPQKYIFFAGRFTKEKAVEDLIEAFAVLNDTSMKLVIAGDADFEDEYSMYIRRLAKKTRNVILTGFIKDKELQVLYSNARLFVLPSRNEGLPIALLEAIGSGSEVLASNIKENLQIGLNERNYFKEGDIYDLSSKMTRLLKDERNDDAIENRIKLMKRNYDWDIVADKTLSVYRNLFNGS